MNCPILLINLDSFRGDFPLQMGKKKIVQFKKNRTAGLSQSFLVVQFCSCVIVFFFLRYMFQKYISSRNIFLVFVWGLWFVTKKIKALARLYLFNLLRNIHFCKKGHPYTQVGRKTIIYSSFLLGILNFFFSFFICLLHFCPFYRTPPGNGNGNFHTHHKLDIKTFVGLKGQHQK